MWSYRTFGGGDNYNNLGSGITVEAQTTIDKGDKFVGVKNDEFVTPTVVSSNIGGTITTLSEDMSVGLGSATISSNTNLPIYFLNEETGIYELFNLEIGDISSITQYKTSISTADFLINEDGSCALIGYGVTKSETDCGNSVLVIDINKKNKSASYKILTDVVKQVANSGTTSEAYESKVYTIDTSWIKKQVLFRKNIIIGTIRCYIYRKDTGAYYNTGCTLAVFKYTGDGFECVYNDIIPVGTNTQKPIYAHASQNDTTFIFVLKNSSNMMLYSFDTETMAMKYSTYLSGTTTSDVHLSKNAKYLMSSKKLYSINQTDLTVVPIIDIAYVGYPSSDGSLIATTYGIYDSNNTKVYSVNKIPTNEYFEPNKWVSGSTINSIVPNTNAEYIISKTVSDKIESNKIYGIASESLTVGSTGNAQLLFNTFE